MLGTAFAGKGLCGALNHIRQIGFIVSRLRDGKKGYGMTKKGYGPTSLKQARLIYMFPVGAWRQGGHGTLVLCPSHHTAVGRKVLRKQMYSMTNNPCEILCLPAARRLLRSVKQWSTGCRAYRREGYYIPGSARRIFSITASAFTSPKARSDNRISGQGAGPIVHQSTKPGNSSSGHLGLLLAFAFGESGLCSQIPGHRLPCAPSARQPASAPPHCQ